ncbi:NADH/NAD(+) kinase [Saccharomyces eubayanus]|uniref:NADH/NAD(+) kinase n=1 Tax=Saccharomyces eubayanus TaxID=1080349 RepID=UPI0006C305BD|nr:YEF1-like protein [Saccharomyces eubayanus]KOG99907.1 YEF1-like protein [Saccharomyces eubayanus]
MKSNKLLIRASTKSCADVNCEEDAMDRLGPVKVLTEGKLLSKFEEPGSMRCGYSEAKNWVRRLSSETIVGEDTNNLYPFYVDTAYDVRRLNKDIINAKIELYVENLIIICNINDVSTVFLMREVVEWTLCNFPSTTVYVQDIFEKSAHFAASDLCKDSNCKQSRIKYWSKEFVQNHDSFFDLVITLGGDGTVLFASSIFPKNVPPIVPFALGSLGFLTNFEFKKFKETLSHVLTEKVRINLRMRLQCKVYHRNETETDAATGKRVCFIDFVSEHHVLNEITIDRGPTPCLSLLELYGHNSLMTKVQGDGLIVATPTGSTAYSLSAGGSLISPSVNAIAVTPICPHTLSFRPIILPDSIELKVRVDLNSRGTSWVNFDGKDRIELKQGDYVVVTASPYAVPTIESSPSEFIESISKNLKWNEREEQKPFAHFLSTKNQEKYKIDSSTNEENVEEMIRDMNENASNSTDSSSISTSSQDEGNLRATESKVAVGRTRQAHFAI